MNISMGIPLADITPIQQPWAGGQWLFVLFASVVVTALATGGLAVGFAGVYEGLRLDDDEDEARAAFTAGAIGLVVGVLACIAWVFELGWALRHAESWLSATVLTGVYLAAGFGAVWLVRRNSVHRPRRTVGFPLTAAAVIVGSIALVVWSGDTTDRWNQFRDSWPNFGIPISVPQNDGSYR